MEGLLDYLEASETLVADRMNRLTIADEPRRSEPIE